MIYLDYSPNTPADPAVLEAFLAAERSFIGNPNSNHPAGQAARQEMARVTDSLASMLGLSPAEIIYTSGASESNNLALKGIAQASRHIGRHIISTALEHSSVGGTLTALQRQGYEIDLAAIRSDGKIDLEQLRELLRRDTILVSVCAVDSELGEEGVCVSVKSACSADGTPSKAVLAVSRDRKNALSSWRISLSHLTTREELAQFMQAFDRCCHRLLSQ